MHTTADDPTKYRSDDEVDCLESQGPDSEGKKISALEVALERRDGGKDEDEQKKQIDEAVEKAEQFKPDPKSMFEQRLQLHAQIL